MGMIARTWFFYASLRTFCAQAVYICKMPDCFNLPYSGPDIPNIFPIFPKGSHHCVVYDIFFL